LLDIRASDSLIEKAWWGTGSSLSKAFTYQESCNVTNLQESHV
jgi:hypothetical protein